VREESEVEVDDEHDRGDRGGHSLGYMVRYRGRAVLLGGGEVRGERIVPVASRVYSEDDGWRIRETKGPGGLSLGARIS